MVGASIGCAVAEGGSDFGLGSLTPKPTNPSMVRSESHGATDRVKKAGGEIDIFLPHREHSISPHMGVQPSQLVTGFGDGSSAIQLDVMSSNRTDERNVELIGMDFKEGGRTSTSS